MPAAPTSPTPPEDPEGDPPPRPGEAAPLGPRFEAALEQFVMLWGEMASHWGINRTMAQIHALLYGLDRPLDTDEIMARLDVSRGNANMNLRSLVEWDLARKVQQPGSRKDFYTAEGDIWKVAATIIEQRQRREIEPVKRALREAVEALHADAQPASAAEVRFVERLDGMHRFVQTFAEVAQALLPFLHERNAGKVRALARAAAGLRKSQAGGGEDAPKS